MTKDYTPRLLSDADMKFALECCDPETKRLPPGFKMFAKQIEHMARTNALLDASDYARDIVTPLAGCDGADQLIALGDDIAEGVLKL